MSNDEKIHDDSESIDIVTEATAEASSGATTNVHGTAHYGDTDLGDGRVPDPDLAQGESD
jgi:hypothetical protein